MIRYKDISIPKPCSMNYDSFELAGTKAFCQSCEKYVHDFRGKDEKFLNDVLKTSKKACGIFYKDEIKNNHSKRTVSFYNKISLNFLSIILFLKSFLFVQESRAAEISSPKIIQGISDSTGVKTIYKKISERTRHQIYLYINNEPVSEHAYPVQGFIYLPDSLKPNDRIKVKIISGTNIKDKTYHFKYKDAQKITITITRKKEFELFKRPYIMGCPSNFW